MYQDAGKALRDLRLTKSYFLPSRRSQFDACYSERLREVMCRVAGGLFSLSGDCQDEKLTTL